MANGKINSMTKKIKLHDSNDVDLVTVDQAGRFVLPKAYRKACRIKSGDQLAIRLDGRNIVLEPRDQQAGLQRKGKLLVFTAGAKEKLSSEDVRDVIEQLRVEREGNLAPGAERLGKH